MRSDAWPLAFLSRSFTHLTAGTFMGKASIAFLLAQ